MSLYPIPMYAIGSARSGCCYKTPVTFATYPHFPFSSFNHLMCPEPGCEYVARRREEIQAHMLADHADKVQLAAAAVSLMLFMCPVCNSHLELKGKEEFLRHVDRCNKGGETREEPNAHQVTFGSISLPSFKCKSCKSKFSSLSEFDQHVMLSRDPTMCEVDVDDVDDGDVADAIKFSQIERLKCDRCDFAFTAIADGPNCRRTQSSQHQGGDLIAKFVA